MNYFNKSDFYFVHDLNRFQDLGHALQISSAWDTHALGSTRLCASHDLSAFKGIQPHAPSQARAAQSQRLLLSRSVLCTVFCSADRARVFARYRDQFAFATPTLLSLGRLLQDHLAQHPGQRQPRSAMTSFCRFGASLDWRGLSALRQRRDQRRSQITDERNRLRIGCDHNRSMSEPVFLGAVSYDKSRHQTSCPDGFTWIDPKFYSHQRRQDVRCQSPVYPRKARLHRGWRLFRDGPL
jgi:hypothetical protein